MMTTVEMAPAKTETLIGTITASLLGAVDTADVTDTETESIDAAILATDPHRYEYFLVELTSNPPKVFLKYQRIRCITITVV